MNVTPILLLTGFLGSGKTTLVNHILSNEKGIKFAVIVNDIGEVNIDASLIERGGVVNSNDDSLVALSNGCICCTLKMDLVKQIEEIMAMRRFDYIVIEASGICEPAPIAQTICSIPQLGQNMQNNGLPRLDCIVTVVDAMRLKDEFGCGDSLNNDNVDEEDIENLIIQQIEFCNIVLINKVSEVNPNELSHIKAVIKALQPNAEIIECDYAKVDIERIINTHMFKFDDVASSASWVQHIDRPNAEIEEEERHSHHYHDEECHTHEHGEECPCGHCHHHHHGEGEAEEYGISTFVYYRRPAFDLNKFDFFAASRWPKEIIRCKGICYFSVNPDMSYLFESAGRQKQLKEAGLWFATAPAEEFEELVAQDPGILKDWDDNYGDRMIKLVFIGRGMDRDAITRALDECLDK